LEGEGSPEGHLPHMIGLKRVHRLIE